MKRYIERSYQATSLKGTIEDSLQSNSPDNAPSVRAVRSALYRPNLLVNGDFLINQRNVTSYSFSNSFVYTLDMWKLINGDMTVNDDGSIHLNNVGHTDSVAESGWVDGHFSQIFDKSLTGIYTVSLRVKNITSGALHVCFAGDKSDRLTITEDGVYTHTFENVTNETTLTLMFNNFDGDVYWVRLDLGSIAYPHVPEDHATALARCREWLYALNIECVVGYAGSTGILYFRDSNLIDLRSEPTVTFLNKTMYIFTNGSTIVITAANSPSMVMRQKYKLGVFYISGYPNQDEIKNCEVSGYFSNSYNVHALFSCEP